MNIESFIIKRMGVNSRYIGDDAAIVGQMLYAQDAFFEDVHFKRSWMSLYQIGYKAMIINLSDAIAMNGSPLYALLTLALPKQLKKEEIAELIRGLQEAASTYGCEIIGGDTIANDKIALSITIIAKGKKPLRRDGFRLGDVLAYTGDIGRSKRDLGKLFKGRKLHRNSRFIKPQLRADFVRKGRGSLSGGMDISDGLFEDAQKMTAMKRMSFKPFIPKDKKIVCSGEEYEMLVSFHPKDLPAIMHKAKQTRTKLTPFAKVVRGAKMRLCKANHF